MIKKLLTAALTLLLMSMFATVPNVNADEGASQDIPREAKPQIPDSEPPRAADLLPDPCYADGNIDGDPGSVVDFGDLTYLINFLDLSGPAPDPLYSADLDGDCVISDADVDALICYLYGGCPDPPTLPVTTCCSVTVDTASDTCQTDGNIDDDEYGILDIGDLSYFVNFLYLGGTAPDPLYIGDIDGNCIIDTLDILALVCYMYGNCSEPPVFPKPTCCNPTIWNPGDTILAKGKASVALVTDSSEEDEYRVSNIGSSGEDGVRLYSDTLISKGLKADLSHVDLSIENASVFFTVAGKLAGGPPVRAPEDDPPIVTLSFCGVTNVSGTIQVVADFNFLGDPNVLMKVYNNRLIGGSSTIPGGGLIAIGTDAGFGLPSILEVAMLADDPPGFTVKFDRIVEFSLVSGPTLYGDEIHMVAENATVSIEDIHAIDINGAFLGFFGMPVFRLDVCCRGFTGNVDDDPSDIIDIGDLTELLSYLYIPPNTPPVCLEEADVDGDPDKVIDIGDVTRIIDFLYIDNTLPEPCP